MFNTHYLQSLISLRLLRQVRYGLLLRGAVQGLEPAAQQAAHLIDHLADVAVLAGVEQV